MKKILKYTIFSILGLLLLIVGLILSLQIPSVQNFVKDKLVSYLESKIHTTVQLDRIYIGFPNSLVLENLYLQGQDVDTLFAVRSLDVGLNIPKLINNTADITSVDLQGVRANVVRDEKGDFNFQYIINAFATDDKEETESKPFVISLDKIQIKDIAVHFTDHQASNDISLAFNSLDLIVKEFDLEKNSYGIDRIDLDGLKLRLKQDLVKEVAENVEEKVDSLSQQNPLSIDLNMIKLTNFDIDYGDDNTKTYAKVIFEELSTKIKKLDLQKNDFDIDNVVFRNANVMANLYLPVDDDSNTTQEESKVSKVDENPMKVKLGSLLLDELQVTYNNTAIVPTKDGIDFNHLDFSKLNLQIKDFAMIDEDIVGSVVKTEITEKSGLQINNFKTDFKYGKKEAYLKGLLLETPYTTLKDELIVNYISTEQLSNDLGNVMLDVNLKDSRVGFKDLILLSPDLKKNPPFSTFSNESLKIDLSLSGRVDDLDISKLYLSGFNGTVVNANGKIKNGTNPDNLWFDLNVKELSSSSKTIYALVPKNTIPSTIALPSTFNVNGRAKGTADNLAADLKLKSTFGNADLKAVVDMRRKNAERYNVVADLNALDVGKFIKNPQLGKVTGKITANGQSFDMNTANAKVNASISSANFNNYTYQNMDLVANIKSGVFDAQLNSKDPNVLLSLEAKGRLDENNPTVKVNGEIEKLDIHTIGFYASPMIIAGKIDADFQDINPDALNGYLSLKDFAISDTKEIFPISEMRLEAVSNDTLNSIVFNSQIADIEMKGKYKLTQILGAVSETINQYYQFLEPPKEGEELKEIEPHQYFTLNAKIKNDDLIRKFVPELKAFETITLEGAFNADDRKLQIDGQIPQVTYGNNIVQDGTLKVTNTENALGFDLYIDDVQSESLELRKIGIAGNVSDNIISYNVSTKDEQDVVQYQIAGTVKSIDEVTELSLLPDGLKLNYDNWNVNPENAIQISEEGIFANQFVLSNKGSEIDLQSEGNIATSPLNVSIKNFKIETITEIIKKDTLLAKGTIDGNATLRDLTGNMNFNADVDVTNLVVFGSAVGNINVKVDNNVADRLNANVVLSGSDNDLKLSGFYNTVQQSFDLNLNIARLQMQTLEGFAMGAIRDTKGYLSGTMDIKGTTDSPSILGNVKFNQVGLTLSELGSSFQGIDDRIDFTNQGINFNRFRINDADGNNLVINGRINTRNYTDFDFGLNVSARNFRLVNSEKDNDSMLYGVLAVNTNLNIRGNLDLPKVDGTITITDKTDFTFVLPQSSPALQAREGIVEFIDQDQLVLQETIEGDKISTDTKLTGLDVNVNIELDPKAKSTIVIDKANGDYVTLQGDADLNGGIDPSGRTTLTGRFEIKEGAYEMSVSMLKRRFDIQPGSSITWNGEPLLAIADLTAIYKTNAAPIDLVEQQLTGKSPAEMNLYKQRIPFNTLLKMEGELLNPEISFDITFDDENPSIPINVILDVESKLSQLRTIESEMNKQVFALLLLNRFIGENPFESSAGVSAETMARQSVSKILSQQLNNLAGDLIAGVELNFDLDSQDEYSMQGRQTRTDLNVGVSKRLLNDRLKVTVGSNFALEGEERPNEQMTNIAGDMSIDYMLSRDGRYTLRAYRKNEYQVALNGQIIETGLGFIMTMDYNKFREIFEKQRRSQRRNNRNNNQVEEQQYQERGDADQDRRAEERKRREEGDKTENNEERESSKKDSDQESKIKEGTLTNERKKNQSHQNNSKDEGE